MTTVVLSRSGGKWRVCLSTGQALYEIHERAYGAAKSRARKEAKERGLPFVEANLKKAGRPARLGTLAERRRARLAQRGRR
jgi:hypothetical protein